MTGVIRGDALRALDELETDSIDALITDPPYSSGGTSVRERARETGKKYHMKPGSASASLPNFLGDSRDQHSYFGWLTLVLSSAWGSLKPGAPVCIFSDWRQIPVISDALQAGGYVWRGIYIWHKNNARPQRGRFRQAAEFVVWGSKGRLALDRDTPCLPGIYSGSAPASSKRVHQTEKPLGLMKQLVEICAPGGTILDPFAGSGTTGVAALQSGRHFVGIELDTRYHDIATERLEASRAG